MKIFFYSYLLHVLRFLKLKKITQHDAQPPIATIMVERDEGEGAMALAGGSGDMW